MSACHYPPVATSALLTYEICKTLHPDIASSCAFLCAMGTHGDLGTTLKWKPPFPDMADTFKLYSKKAINDAVSLINARKQSCSTGRYESLLIFRLQQDGLRNSTLRPPGMLSSLRKVPRTC